MYLSLAFELPTQVDLRRKTCGSRVLGTIYWDLEEVKQTYNVPDAENQFDVDLIFTNIIDRKALTAASGKISDVDCSKGFCGADIPDGEFRKKVDFFAGTFTENYQLTMYPFDSQIFEFNFTLYSTLGEVAMYTPQVNFPLKQDFGAYYMSDMAWSSEVTDDGTFGSCRIVATRNFAPVLLNLLTPTLLFVLIAILSLKLDIKLAMPRVGSTLFALLILTQYRNSALAVLPPTSDFIWVGIQWE